MHLYSLTFLCLGLPLFLGLYRVVPPRLRVGFLLLLSLGFYALLEWRTLPLMVISIGLDYAASYGMSRQPEDKKFRLALMWAVAVKAVGLIVVISSLSQIYKMSAPLGLFIYTLSSLGYVIDVYRGEASFERDPLRFGLFCCFFGKLYAGPLMDYGVMREQMEHPDYTLENTGQGIWLFIIGFAKKVILADGISGVHSALAGLAIGEHTVLSVWSMVFCGVFSTYFLLSGYCDMAVGLGRMVGYQLPRNFYFPLQSRSVTDFFDRFNMTVHKYIRRYVYRPLGEDKNKTPSVILNIMLINMLMGLWYGLELNKLLWGAFLGAFITWEYLQRERFDRVPSFFARLYSFVIILVSFAIFQGRTPIESVRYLGIMMGWGGRPAANDWVLELLRTHYLLVFACFICSTSVFTMLGRLMHKRAPRGTQGLMAAAAIALLVLSIAFCL